MKARFRIIRIYTDRPHLTRVIKTGLTMAQAAAHVAGSESSSTTARLCKGKERTERLGAWHDVFEDESLLPWDRRRKRDFVVLRLIAAGRDILNSEWRET